MKKSTLPIVICALVATLVSAAFGDDADRLGRLFDREWEFRLESDPLFATGVGRHEWNHLLADVSAAARARRAETTRGFLAELAAIDRSSLDRASQVNYDIFKRQLDLRVAAYEFREWEIPINADSGFHSSFARLGKNVPLETVTDYDNYISRLRGFAELAAQHIANMRSGLARGMKLPKVVLQGIEGTILPHVVEKVEDSVLWGPFESLPATFSDRDRSRLRKGPRARRSTHR